MESCIAEFLKRRMLACTHARMPARVRARLRASLAPKIGSAARSPESILLGAHVVVASRPLSRGEQAAHLDHPDDEWSAKAPLA
jgi:hypothetical protein